MVGSVMRPIECSRVSDAMDRESLRLLRMAEAMAGVGHWRFDRPQNTLFWSDEVYRIHQRALDNPPSLEDALSAYLPDDREMVEKMVKAALQQGTPFTFTAQLLCPGGDIRHVISHGQVERDGSGAIVGLFGVFQDVTKAAIAEAQLIAARDAANSAASAKGTFLATMSHEIRTPMTGVLGMIELLKANPAKDRQQCFLDALERSASQLMTVLDDILDFSKIDGQKLDLEHIDFDLRLAAQSVIDLFAPVAARNGLALDLHFAGNGADGIVRGDPMRLQQILSNLISNAIKFTHAGAVTVTIAHGVAVKGRWLFNVSDTGIGIPEGRANALFSPFVQADPSTTRTFGGTGLGLAISQRLVQAMGGEIAVISMVGTGSTFAFDIALPAGRIAPRPGPVAVPSTAAIPATVAGPMEILLAEDNAVNQILICALLSQAGHRVTIVANGQEAVAMASERLFDVILMDMQMPVLDGLAATRLIRQLPNARGEVPIVAITADAALDRRGRYADVGLTDFLTKPIDSRKLTATLAAIAGSATI